MTLVPALVDLLVGITLIFAIAATTALTQGEPIRMTPTLKMPRSPHPPGSEALAGSLMVSIRQEGRSLRYQVGEGPVTDLATLVEHILRLKPVRVVLVLGQDLSVSELLPSLEALGNTGSPLTIAYREG